MEKKKKYNRLNYLKLKRNLSKELRADSSEGTKPSNKKQIGIKVGHDCVNSTVDVKGTLHKK
jgi:hypothetical protein